MLDNSKTSNQHSVYRAGQSSQSYITLLCSIHQIITQLAVYSNHARNRLWQWRNLLSLMKIRTTTCFEKGLGTMTFQPTPPPPPSWLIRKSIRRWRQGTWCPVVPSWPHKVLTFLYQPTGHSITHVIFTLLVNILYVTLPWVACYLGLYLKPTSSCSRLALANHNQITSCWQKRVQAGRLMG